MSFIWQAWTSVSEAVVSPARQFRLYRGEISAALFATDPGGGVYAIKAVPGYGWEAVPESAAARLARPSPHCR